MLEKCKGTLVSKGREYQNNKSEQETNVFNNFERGAHRLGLERETILLVYMAKHFDSVNTFIKDLQSGKSVKEIEAKLTEPINGRIMDLINYCLLLNSMINDKRGRNRKDKAAKLRKLVKKKVKKKKLTDGFAAHLCAKGQPQRR